jgi:hypothetical protein
METGVDVKLLKLQGFTFAILSAKAGLSYKRPAKAS